MSTSELDQHMHGLSDRQLERYAAEFQSEDQYDPAWVKLNSQQRTDAIDRNIRATAASKELGRRRVASQREQAQADAQKQAEQKREAESALIKEEFRRQARAAFPGTDQEFNTMFNGLWQQHQVDIMRRNMSATRDELLRSGRYTGF
jgi:hypothetical protein